MCPAGLINTHYSLTFHWECGQSFPQRQMILSLALHWCCIQSFLMQRKRWERKKQSKCRIVVEVLFFFLLKAKFAVHSKDYEWLRSQCKIASTSSSASSSHSNTPDSPQTCTELCWLHAISLISWLFLSTIYDHFFTKYGTVHIYFACSIQEILNGLLYLLH